MSAKGHKIPLLLLEIVNERLESCKELFTHTDFDSLELARFNATIHLQEYQRESIKRALCAIKLYQSDSAGLCEAYREALGQNNIKLDSKSLKLQELCNMASFWMATGSGKSIVMIKLIHLMQSLMKSGEIESKPIMLLVPNDKILEQFRAHIASFNAYHTQGLICKELKEYESGGAQNAGEVVFLGRSDLLDMGENVGKDSSAKRIDYANFKQEMGWYILLDEAHKGDSKDSVRKGYVRELAWGKQGAYPLGFILNFSATFDNDAELLTCAFNYNLECFNVDGYGKNIVVMEDNLKAFKDRHKTSAHKSGKLESSSIESSKDSIYAPNYEENVKSHNEKLERILESFILFSAMREELEWLRGKFNNLTYHNPLIIAVADKVNTKDAGIKLYFEAILQILKDSKDIGELAKNLSKKLESSKLYFKEQSISEGFLERVAKVDSKTLREQIFYATEASSLECCKIKGNNKELAFKSKNATKPFLLLNIGNIKEWEKSHLDELHIESGEDIAGGYFEGLNAQDSPIQIMMGSKVFSEGWDSNRVNFINFINIGSKNAKKYVLQTIGRGVRIEPFKDIRKRLKESGELDFSQKEWLGSGSLGIESVFIMATENEAIQGILEGIERFKTQGRLQGFKRTHTLEPLLVPLYTDSAKRGDTFVISHCDFRELSEYVESYDEDVLLLANNIANGLSRADLGFSTLQKNKAKNAR